MNCRRFEQILLNGSMDTRGDVSRAMVEHLRTCGSCRQLQQAMNLVRSQAHTLQSEEAPLGIADRAFAIDVSSRRQSKPAFQWMRPAFAAGAVLLAVLVLGRIFLSHGPRIPTQQIVKSDGKNQPKELISPKNEQRVAKGILRNESGPIIRDKGHPNKTMAFNQPSRQNDLDFLNGASSAAISQWVHPNIAQKELFSPKFTRGDDFVSVPFPRVAALSRDLAREALDLYRQEKEIVDDRLSLKKVTIGIKGQSFEELCRRLTESTGIQLRAGHTVAQDKLTIYCTDKPLRDLMRQINQVFGYQWARNGKANAYEYELFQDMKSQLAEEAMRNRDRDEALLDLDRKMQQMKKYMALSPKEAHDKAWSPDRAGTSQEELDIYNHLGGHAWGGAHLYYTLSNEQLAALRDGETLAYSTNPRAGQRVLPGNFSSGVVSSLSDLRVVTTVDGLRLAMHTVGGAGRPLSDFNDGRYEADLRLDFKSLGEVTLWAGAGIGFDDEEAPKTSHPIATGMSPGVREPKNAEANAALAREPLLQPNVTVKPVPSIWESNELVVPKEYWFDQPRANIGDVLEAFHKATGMDVIGDYFTRIYMVSEVSANNERLFDALNRIGDKMRVRWTRKEGWLRFRSTSFYVDRLIEIPNSQLSRWCVARQKQGWMTPEIMMEAAQLPDAKLDTYHMSEGVREIFGLREWYNATSVYTRPHWRFLAALPSGLRSDALSDKGLAVSKLSPLYQSKFFAMGTAAAELARMRPRQPKKDWIIKIHRNNEPGRLAGSKLKATMPPTDITYKFEDAAVGPWTVQIHLYEVMP